MVPRAGTLELLSPCLLESITERVRLSSGTSGKERRVQSIH